MNFVTLTYAIFLVVVVLVYWAVPRRVGRYWLILASLPAIDWAEHLPKLTLFWCRALLGIEGYVGNPFRAHALVNERSPFTMAHFERWLQLFYDTVELGWVGPHADRALELARNVARVHSGQLVGRSTIQWSA